MRAVSGCSEHKPCGKGHFHDDLILMVLHIGEAVCMTMAGEGAYCIFPPPGFPIVLHAAPGTCLRRGSPHILGGEKPDEEPETGTFRDHG